MHSYVNSGSGGFQFYNTPANCAATQPPGAGGNGNFWDPAWVPSGWGAPVVDTGFQAGACVKDPQTGANVPRLSFSTSGSSSDLCPYMWFRQGFLLTEVNPPTVTPLPSPTNTPPNT